MQYQKIHLYVHQEQVLGGKLKVYNLRGESYITYTANIVIYKDTLHSVELDACVVVTNKIFPFRGQVKIRQLSDE